MFDVIILKRLKLRFNLLLTSKVKKTISFSL